MIICADYVHNFSIQSRGDILKIHSRRMNLMCGIDLKKIAGKMNGASGAELKVCLVYTLYYAPSSFSFCGCLVCLSTIVY
jgi:SpoVK/Ycf46/Vps4 family AAA+-type ATPase